MLTLPRTSEQVDRFKFAALGLGVTLAPVAALASAQFLFAPQIVVALGGIDPMIDTWAVSAFRSSLAEGYSVVALVIIVYWLLAATLGKGKFLKIRSANLALALSGLTFAFAMVIASTDPVPGRLFRGACPILGLSDTYPAFGFDAQSSCDSFTHAAAPLVLLGLPTILLVISAILRIVVSRRR